MIKFQEDICMKKRILAIGIILILCGCNSNLTAENSTAPQTTSPATLLIESTDNTMETSAGTSESVSSYSLTESSYNETTSVMTTIQTTDMTELSVSSLVQPFKIDDSYYEFIQSVFEYQNENFPFFEGTDTRYSFYDFNKDGIDELLWLAPTSGGFTLIDAPLFIVFGNGDIIKIRNDIYITKSIDDLVSFEIYTNSSGKNVYCLTTYVFSTGEHRNCIRFYDENFNILRTFLTIEDQVKKTFCIIELSLFNNSEYIVDENEYNDRLDEYVRDLEMIQNIDFHELKSFGPENINDYFISD
jgi:hypothetical protein